MRHVKCSEDAQHVHKHQIKISFERTDYKLIQRRCAHAVDSHLTLCMGRLHMYRVCEMQNLCMHVCQNLTRFGIRLGWVFRCSPNGIASGLGFYHELLPSLTSHIKNINRQTCKRACQIQFQQSMCVYWLDYTCTQEACSSCKILHFHRQ